MFKTLVIHGLAATAIYASSQSLVAAQTPARDPPPQSKPAQIDRNGALILIRSTILALHQANVTGNYTVLRDLGAPGFQSANSAARLGEIFAGLRNQHLDLSGVSAIDPQLTSLPEVNAAGQLHIVGFFPSTPLQIAFDLLFAPSNGQWQPIGIGVNVGQGSPVAPDATPAPAAKAAPVKK